MIYKIQSNIRTAPLVMIALMLSACASKKIAHDQVDTVKKVAVIGFGVEQRMPNGVGTLLGALSKTSDDNGPMGGMKPAKIAEPAEHAKIMYDALQAELGKGMGWKVLARQDLVRNPEYSAFFREKTAQPQFRPMVSGKNVEMFIPEGIVENFLLNTMSMTERRELIKKLGVDAVAITHVHIELANRGGLSKLVGAGEFHPVAKVGFALYNATQEAPIWMDANADGDEATEGVAHSLGFSNVKDLNKQAIATTDSAFHHLVERYRE